MCRQCRVAGLHAHSDLGSNLRLRDATNRVEDLIQTSNDLGYISVALTEHESLSSSVKGIKAVERLKKEGKISEDFKIILGNEIYLVDSLEEVRDNYKPGGVTKFPHFLLIALDTKGHEMLRYMSSRAWEQSFYTGAMLRTPTTKEFLAEVVKNDPGHLVAASACLGSELCIHLLSMKQHLENNNRNSAKESYLKACRFVEWCIDVFTKENFFIEIQPAYSEEQIFCNEHLLKLAQKYELEYIVTTDAHYPTKEDQLAHSAFLRSKEGEREVDSFYEATFIQSVDEIHKRLNYLDHDVIKKALDNTVKISERVQEYKILHAPVIPKIELPEFNIRGLFKKVYDQYPYIKKMVESESDQDRFIIKLIEDGFLKLLPYKAFSNQRLHEVTSRINEELGELWEISETLNQRMTSYYITVAKVVDIIWDDGCDGGNSFVGISRGSAMGFLICYLLGITQISPLDYEIDLPHWRHLSKSRIDLPDIDLDSEASKRDRILQALKKNFGEKRVLQVATFGTEASKSAVQTSARGLGIDNDIAMYVSGLIPFERGASWSLRECVHGNEEKEREPVTEFVKEINKHKDWLNVAMKIEGLVNKRSIHASGVLITNEDYYKTNAMMRAPNSAMTTQFSLDDCELLSNVKFDLLTVENLDKMRVTVDALIQDGVIEKQKTLKETYDKYLHPRVLDIKSKEIYEKVATNSVIDLFQFSTQIGVETVKRTKPTNLIELSAANSLMRLMGGHGEETPIDSFIRFKADISEWYNEMKQWNLNTQEIETMKNHLLPLNGVADTQEAVMKLSMDKKIAGFDIPQANKLRKVIAKKKTKEIENLKKEFYEAGQKLGNRKEILEYVWEVQVVRQLGYSFSVLHTLAYSMMGLQQVNLNLRYDPIYWQTACLTVNSGSIENQQSDDENDPSNNRNQSTDYGKIASAIGNMMQRGVKIGLPDINKANFGFSPDVVNQQIIFGLKGMNGIGDETVQHLIRNRPYQSFEDFLERMYVTGIIKKSQMIQLIKGGCFELFGDRMEMMKEFINHIFAKKEKLNMQNFAMLVNNNLLPDQYKTQAKMFNFRKYIMKHVHRTEGKNKLLLLDYNSAPFFYEHFSSESIVDYHNNFPVVSEKIFKKEYDTKMSVLKEWFDNPETLVSVNDYLFQEEWDNLASGNLSSWEMDSLSFYYTVHELAHVNRGKYRIQNFFELPEEPKVIDMLYGTKPKFKLDYIVGTVLDKNKNNHTVSLLTPEGVVTVKYYDGAFAHYNRQVSRPKADGTKEIVEKSWFTRGNKLVIYGFRRGSQFKPYKYKDSPNQHTTMMIKNIDTQGNLSYITEREE